MKHVEVAELVSAVPVKMTREQKLMRWADLIRRHPGPLALFHGIEYMNRRDLEAVTITSAHPFALSVAQADPVLQAEGLQSPTSLGDALRFFEISQHEAHAFSCDCGGAISNTDQAQRIERLAYRR
ncbi:hypothetical protein ABIG06_006293 [Bradyrhizobium sp. USDA 326]|uniref:hypothetical protein n=1 Tax=unclassified Bradyrhizobium TaxID=2631580 RepID=UPI003513B90B